MVTNLEWKESLGAKAMDWVAGELGSVPDSATDSLQDLGQVT